MDNETLKEDVDFLNKNLKPESIKDSVLSMVLGKTDYRKFVKTKGVSQDVIKQISDANKDIFSASLEFGKTKLLKSEKEVESARIKIFSDFGNFETRVRRTERNHKNPKTGEVITKYGGFDIVAKIKPILDKELVTKVLNDIELSMKK